MLYFGVFTLSSTLSHLKPTQPTKDSSIATKTEKRYSTRLHSSQNSSAPPPPSKPISEKPSKNQPDHAPRSQEDAWSGLQVLKMHCTKKVSSADEFIREYEKRNIHIEKEDGTTPDYNYIVSLLASKTLPKMKFLHKDSFNARVDKWKHQNKK